MGNNLKVLRELKGWTLDDAAAAMGVSRGGYIKLERGERKLSERTIGLAAKAFGVGPADLIEGSENGPDEAPRIPRSHLITPVRDFRIYGSAEGGSGQIIVSTDPIDIYPRPMPVEHVKEAYGLYITGESMVPEYEPGDIAIVNPRLPIIANVTAILYAKDHGEARATIKRVRRFTDHVWLLTQWNPPEGMAPDFELPRSEWSIGHRVVGRYTRR
ncbi:hypothetical protein RHODGE_RHODGE_04008 [Rhodoplanes serenus]|uniref:HTH cro/C1-type domain-containing protein n=2 Tax=Nitrobacteraceae TaxID=41294 RepID=A0A447CZX2_9BRAD|nr:hypothetical protein RHODGE_RHODGE_04008 [Rhodoplanes serenus]